MNWNYLLRAFIASLFTTFVILCIGNLIMFGLIIFLPIIFNAPFSYLVTVIILMLITVFTTIYYRHLP